MIWAAPVKTSTVAVAAQTASTKAGPSLAARATSGISVAAFAATGDVCDVESIVWVMDCADSEDCVSASAG